METQDKRADGLKLTAKFIEAWESLASASGEWKATDSFMMA